VDLHNWITFGLPAQPHGLIVTPHPGPEDIANSKSCLQAGREVHCETTDFLLKGRAPGQAPDLFEPGAGRKRMHTFFSVPRGQFRSSPPAFCDKLTTREPGLG